MADKPIPFSGPMVRALLDGRKTQTRRFLDLWYDEPPAFVHQNGEITAYDHDMEPYRWLGTYAVGDRLWVQEDWRLCSQMDNVKLSEMSAYEPVQYEVDGCVRELSCMMIMPGELRAPVDMPRWASRLTLTVTDVRVQRLQEISEEDAKAEGIERLRTGRGYYDPTVSKAMVRAGHYCRTARDAFQILWDSLNAKRGFGWDANPWVAAYSFTVHRCNIDQMGDAA